MKTVTVAQLRQNPAPTLADVERGEEYVVLRYRREIARIVPRSIRRTPVTAEDVAGMFASAPLDGEWGEELERDRASDVGADPWATR